MSCHWTGLGPPPLGFHLRKHSAKQTAFPALVIQRTVRFTIYKHLRSRTEASMHASQISLCDYHAQWNAGILIAPENANTELGAKGNTRRIRISRVYGTHDHRRAFVVDIMMVFEAGAGRLGPTASPPQMKPGLISKYFRFILAMMSRETRNAREIATFCHRNKECQSRLQVKIVGVVRHGECVAPNAGRHGGSLGQCCCGPCSYPAVFLSV